MNAVWGTYVARTRLFDVATGRQLAELSGGDTVHAATAFSSDGKTLATANEKGELTLWDLSTHEERLTIRWEGQSIESSAGPPTIDSLAFLPDGRSLVSSDANAKVWLWRSSSQDRVEECEQRALLEQAEEYKTSGRRQDAVDLLEHGEDLHISDPLARRRGHMLAELGRWDEAVADFERVAKAGDVVLIFRDWHELAVAQLAKGDQGDYRAACAEMLDKFFSQKSKLPERWATKSSGWVLWTCALAPNAVQDYGPVLACATEEAGVWQSSGRSLDSLGAILYRMGRVHDAIEYLTELDRPTENPKPKEKSALAYTGYLRRR
jgi:tetratricopeptide (TPR) repeat protein